MSSRRGERARVRLRCRVAVGLLLLSASCLYQALGMHSDVDAETGLRVGTKLDEALQQLERGGQIAGTETFGRGAADDWSSDIDAGARRELRRVELEHPVQVERVVRVDRAWGFAGYAVFWLFLDADDRMCGWFRRHYN